MHKQEQSTGNNASILLLKPMGRVNQSLKQRVSVASQNGNLSLQKKKKLTKDKRNICQLGRDVWKK